MKELLKKAFEAGIDYQYDCEHEQNEPPNFEEWYTQNEREIALVELTIMGQGNWIKEITKIIELAIAIRKDWADPRQEVREIIELLEQLKKQPKKD